MSRAKCAFLAGLLVFCYCAKSPEQKGDEFLRQGDSRAAYIYYQKAVTASKGNPGKKLSDKYLAATVKKAKERLVDDESLQSVTLFHEDYKKYVNPSTDPGITSDYTNFLCAWADSVLTKFDDVRQSLAILEIAGKLDASSKLPAARARDLKTRHGQTMLELAKGNFDAAKANREPLDMIGAEYYGLVAEKYLPGDESVAAFLKKVRRENLSTYAAYDRAMEDGRTDPDIDKYSIYLTVVGKRFRRGLTLDGTIYNLSSDPLELHSSKFTAVDKNGKVHKASSRGAKFAKITLDVKMESKFTLRFPTLKSLPRKFVFKDKEREAVKFFP